MKTLKALIKSLRLFIKGRLYLNKCRTRAEWKGNANWRVSITKKSSKRSLTILIFTFTIEFIEEIQLGGYPCE